VAIGWRQGRTVQTSIHLSAALQCLVLISVANMAPVAVKRVLGARFSYPIDGGLVLQDGYPLLGKSKTWRGLAAAVFLTLVASLIIGLPATAGALVGASAMAGDCLSSFAKRRLGLKPSSMAMGLDQGPESFLPALVCSVYIPLSFLDVALVVLAFFFGALALSKVFFAVGLRDQPY
jgi:CDP-diglyceride synthetase